MSHKTDYSTTVDSFTTASSSTSSTNSSKSSSKSSSKDASLKTTSTKAASLKNASSFHRNIPTLVWLDDLEKEFDKSFVDLDLLLGDFDSDQVRLF